MDDIESLTFNARDHDSELPLPDLKLALDGSLDADELREELLQAVTPLMKLNDRLHQHMLKSV